MRIGRRPFLAGLGAGLIAPALPRAGQAAAPLTLTAAPATAQLAPPDMGATTVWAYAGAMPGPVIRVAQGGRVRALLKNALDQPTTIHWHGIRIENAMDGVPGMTQPPVEPGGEFLYDFAVPDAGTYWYHPHRQSWEQQARGLAGALIVEEPDAPAVDRDLPVLLQDWRLAESGLIHEESFGSMRDFTHAGRLGNWTTVNGNGEATWPARRHERLRLRFINAATARIYTLALKGMEGVVMAVDGQPVSPAAAPEQMVLAPAQRLDLIVDVTAAEGEEAAIAVIDRDGAYAAVALPVAGTARAARLEPPAELAPNPVARVAGLDGAERVRLVMEGGAMGGMASARLGAETLDIRTLVGRGKAWAFNGHAGMDMAAPLFDVARGRTVRIEMVNDTRWPHAMHVHGHHFQTVAGEAVAGPLWDTYLMDPQETVEIAFVADNPGDWMFHCHMAEHMEAGMMTWFRVR